MRVIAGFGLLLAGVVMLVVPGPGWLTIAAGLSMLSADFPWARRALDALKAMAAACRDRLMRAMGYARADANANRASDSGTDVSGGQVRLPPRGKG
jgi:hypothetical protein